MPVTLPGLVWALVLKSGCSVVLRFKGFYLGDFWGIYTPYLASGKI